LSYFTFIEILPDRIINNLHLLWKFLIGYRYYKCHRSEGCVGGGEGVIGHTKNVMTVFVFVPGAAVQFEPRPSQI
jgi:hypothetical protein